MLSQRITERARTRERALNACANPRSRRPARYTSPSASFARTSQHATHSLTRRNAQATFRDGLLSCAQTMFSAVATQVHVARNTTNTAAGDFTLPHYRASTARALIEQRLQITSSIGFLVFNFRAYFTPCLGFFSSFLHSTYSLSVSG